MRFEARVINAQHELLSLSFEALDAEDAKRQLEAQALRTLSLRATTHSGLSMLARRRERFPLLLFAQELLALIGAGLSVIEAVEALIEKNPSVSTRSILARVHDDLRAGQRLSSALQRQPTAFPPLFVGMVHAAEGTSSLQDALSRYIDYRSRIDAVRAKVFSAAIYPVILLIVGGGVTAFLLGYVVPRFASVYEGTGRALPWASRLLLEWGQFVCEHGAPLVAVAVGGNAVLGAWAVLAWRSGSWQRWLLRLPWVGERVHLMELSRLYLTLGALLEGGLPIAQALLLAQMIGSPPTRLALARVKQAIGEGQAFSASLERESLTTPVSVRLLRVGEASGQLGGMLRRAALFYEGETSRWIDRFTRAFEPVLMAAIGLVIGLIVLLLYMPIFDLAGSLQ
jgi:general secretion pathway protein F